MDLPWGARVCIVELLDFVWGSSVWLWDLRVFLVSIPFPFYQGLELASHKLAVQNSFHYIYSVLLLGIYTHAYMQKGQSKHISIFSFIFLSEIACLILQLCILFSVYFSDFFCHFIILQKLCLHLTWDF